MYNFDIIALSHFYIVALLNYAAGVTLMLVVMAI